MSDERMHGEVVGMDSAEHEIARLQQENAALRLEIERLTDRETQLEQEVVKFANRAYQAEQERDEARTEAAHASFDRDHYAYVKARLVQAERERLRADLWECFAQLIEESMRPGSRFSMREEIIDYCRHQAQQAISELSPDLTDTSDGAHKKEP